MEINWGDLQSHKQEWSNSEKVVLSNFFPDEDAKTLWEYYYKKPDHQYDLAIFPAVEKLDQEGVYPVYRCKPGDPSIPKRERYVRKLLNENLFSYIYRRTEDFHPLFEIFSSKEFIAKLETITGYQNLKFDWNSTFVSNYGPGHFNGPHHDGINGRIAFVFHLSQNWMPWYGGLFLRLSKDYKKVDTTVVPSFNKLVVFDVYGNEHGSPHLVTEVAQGCANRRISFTGWYN